ncbi:hypothetical protein [Mycolicibacterium nivoides]|uniref:Secretion protein EspK n=1 Tax=Mycolicibacterium nivoides TaxID=2487344 RepID=A0ABW9LCQ3_9MYCO
MVGPGAWPEFDESVFDQRKEMLSHVKSAVTQARANWDRVSAGIFNGLLVWVGGSASAAAAKAEQHSKAMEEIEKQLADAIEWCGSAWVTTRMAKKAIADYVDQQFEQITKLLDKAQQDGTDAQEAEDAAQKIAEQAYAANQQFLDNLADNLPGKDETAGTAPSESHAAAPLDNGTGTAGSAPSGGGNSDSNGGTSDSNGQAPASLLTGQKQGAPQGGDEKPAGAEGLVPVSAKEGPASQARPGQDGPAGAEGVVPVSAKEGPASQARPDQDAPATGLPSFTQPTAGAKLPTAPTAPPAPSAPAAPTAPSLGGAGGGGSAASSPLSSAASAAASAGIDPSKAAGQAPVGGAPTNPLQEFSKAFADSAGTPVHAASSGGAPPPLAPSPVVPASDAMAPASTTPAPVAQTGAQAPTAPVQAPGSGGPMGGMGMGGMPLGPPPTAPPAAPVAPPAAPPPASAPPASIAGGAQVAPIPVSAARAERDAALNAAKRSGSDPLEMARRIAAALNAPDMVNKEDLFFHWITAVTQEGRIAVANNYGMAFMPEQVRLPESVVMVSADESIPPSDRASWATYPAVALQGWAQHHDMKLRALVGFENQFSSDSGVHRELLTPQDIPASGKMAGRDRLQVIAPQIAARLGQIADGDLVKVLPPAPVVATPPDEDQRTQLWEDVWAPVISRSASRVKAHLNGFSAFAVHAQERALYDAHTAAAMEDQRRAVEDFIYWQHVGQLTADGIGG